MSDYDPCPVCVGDGTPCRACGRSILAEQRINVPQYEPRCHNRGGGRRASGSLATGVQGGPIIDINEQSPTAMTFTLGLGNRLYGSTQAGSPFDLPPSVEGGNNMFFGSPTVGGHSMIPPPVEGENQQTPLFSEYFFQNFEDQQNPRDEGAQSLGPSSSRMGGEQHTAPPTCTSRTTSYVSVFAQISCIFCLAYN